MEGVVKFNCHWNQSGPVISDEQYEIINYWRGVVKQLVGVIPGNKLNLSN